jgi:hypothetical protein
MPADPRPEMLRTYANAQSLAHAVADALTDEAFNWKPDAKRWSVGECFLHLNTMAKGYLPVLEAAVAADGPRADGPYRYGWVSRRFIAAVRPGSRPMPTGGAMKPPAAHGGRSAVDKARALDGFDAYTERFVGVVRASDGLDLARIRVASPFLPLLRLPLGAFLEALGLHNVRHMQQAERVTQAPGFPAG